MNYKYDYFISYRRACGGALAARTVMSILCKYGKKVFLDTNDIKIGEYMPQIFNNAIKNSNNFILILNEDSWRETEKIDFYYEEIIRITEEKGNIIPIEFANNILNSVPIFLQRHFNRDIKRFEKISFKNDYNLFDKQLWLLVNNVPNSKLPKFSMPFFNENLIMQDEKVDKLYNGIIKHRFFNLVGDGGIGKTTLTYLLAERYKAQLDNIASVIVNDNFKDDFVSQINATLHLTFAQEDSIDDKFNKIIFYLDKNYQVGNNLLIFDVNDIFDKDVNDKVSTELIDDIIQLNNSLPNNWKVLFLSRIQLDGFPTMNLNIDDEIDTNFLKELFLKKAGNLYNNFVDFDSLWQLIYFNPLLAEQLGIFLHVFPKMKTLAEIKEILYADKFQNKERSGVSSYNRNETETTIINFLNNLIDYKDFTPDEQVVLRHFVLWKSEYIQYNIIEDLLQGICENLEETLSNLCDRSILSFDETKSAYKLHSLLADSLRKQIDVTKQDYKTYCNNIIRIENYNCREFLPYADCIGNSLCEYEITKNVDFLNDTASKFDDISKTDYATQLYDKCIAITNQRLETEPKNIDYLEDLSYAYNNLANLQKDHLNDYKSAECNYNNTIRIAQKIVKISSAPKYLNFLAAGYNDLANLQNNHLNDPESAEINYNQAIGISEKIIRTSDDSQYLYDLANAYYNLAIMQRSQLGDYQSAVENTYKTIMIMETIIKRSNNSIFVTLLANAYNNLANLQADLHKYESAKENYNKAITIKKSLI